MTGLIQRRASAGERPLSFGAWYFSGAWSLVLGVLLLLALGLPSASAFSLMGPINEAFQVPEIAYNIRGDIGAPKNIGEEYRWTTPTNYYAFDTSFLDYFGSNGVYAIEQAIAIINGVGSISSYSADLSEVPLESRRINYRAEALHLHDLKSSALFLMLEELGLSDAVRWTWTLRSRNCPSCPICAYGVIKRNFDPASWEPSSYVNSVLYTYRIFEICSGGPPLAEAVEFTVDPLAREYEAVTSLFGFFGETNITYGIYYTGLTRDEIGGLRYLYRTNNMNVEATSSDSVLLRTNSLSQVLFPSNLTLFALQALTNNAAGLVALYPDLVITDTTNTFTNVFTTNVTAYFTNSIGDPAGTPAHLAFLTNVVGSVQTLFHHTFANVVTLQLVSNRWITVPLAQIPPATNPAIVSIQTTVVAITNHIGDPAGTFRLETNVTTVTFPTNQVTGDFFVLNSNICDIAILSPQLTNVVLVTNVLTAATNFTANSNGPTAILSYEQDEIDYFTNRIFIGYQIFCETNTVALRQGMDHIQFFRTSFDSLLGRFYQPITNFYYLIQITNSAPRTNWFRRIVTRPDFIFDAADLSGTRALRTDTAGNFRTNNSVGGLAGPGNIEPNMTFTFNKTGPILNNFYNPFFLPDSGLSEANSTTNFIWGSFDGSTNAPIVYPDGNSIMNLENQVIFQILTPDLPDGSRNISYSTNLIASGGQLPYTWQPAQGSSPLPPGLSLASNGLISGTPTVVGTNTFTVNLTDSTIPTPLTRSRTFTIIIHP
jgi:hypothetical protein